MPKHEDPGPRFTSQPKPVYKNTSTIFDWECDAAGSNDIIYKWNWISRVRSYCIVLYCIVLYCVALYYIVLYCIVSYCLALHFNVFSCILFPFNFIMFSPTL